MDSNISFSKIVATPTLKSWSQAYNAGKLFAVLSLEETQELPEAIESLNMFGKNLLERLEQEFFVIEDKNLESIRKAVSATFDQKIEGIAISFALGAFVNNILYLFGLGNAKVFIKREGSLGLALNSENVAAKNVASSSGFLREGDLIVLATDAFSQVIAHDDLDSNLNNTEPSEIAESLAPKIHKAENGKISAIVIKYQKPLADPSATQGDLPASARQWQAGFGEALRAGEVVGKGVVADEPIGTIQEENKTEKSISFLKKYFILLKSKLRKPNIRFNPTKKFFLALAIIIVGIIISSIFLTIREQNNAKVRALFSQIYPQAQKKYDEGQGLADLNKSFARDAFSSAQKILKDNESKFPAKSKELAQTQDLLKKIDDGLAQVSPIDKSGLDRSALSITVQNGSGIEGTAGKAALVLKDIGYNVVSTGNADNYNYIGVTIKVKKESNNFLPLLKKDLSKDYTVKSTSSDLPSDSPTAALIIIGR